jgi:putative membrane protein
VLVNLTMVGALVADRYGMMDGDGNGWMWVMGGLMMLLVVVALGFVVWAIVRSTQHSVPDPHSRAREILAERFARGEITPEEYRERSQQLV